MATTNMPGGVDTFPLAPYFGNSGGVGKWSQWAELVGKALGATETLAISAAAAATTGARKRINVADWGVLPTATDAVNTFAFNSHEVLESGPCDFIFPPGTYSHAGLALTRSQHRIIGETGSFGVTLNYTGSGNAITIQGTTSGGFAGRVIGCGMEGVVVHMAGTEAARALFIRHATACYFERVSFQNSRADGAIDASNFADSIFFACEWLFCGSIDDSNKPVIKFGYDGNGVWAVDQVTFLRCKFEANGDRIVDFRQGGGFLVNKITFIATKFEASGTASYNMGGDATTGATFYMDNCGWINFTACDFTLQNMQSGHAILPTCFRLINTTWLALSNCSFNFGSGSAPKVFTHWFTLNAANQLLTMDNVWFNSGNSTALPGVATEVIACTNSPRVSYKNVGFTPTQGGALTASAWITGAVNAGGIIA